MPRLTCGDRSTDAWLEAVRRRRSRRSFDGTPIAEETLSALAEVCEGFRPHDCARAVLLTSVPDGLFRGIVGSYGKVQGATSALVLVGTGDGEDTPVAVGYTGEALVLEAVARGLDTCWISGTFKASVASRVASAAAGERVWAVVALGHGAPSLSGAERTIFGQKSDRGKRRRPLDAVAPGMGASWPEWAVRGVEAARLAPSAANRQPWLFRFEGGSVVVSYEGADVGKYPKRLDCGIAMLHFEIAARGAGAFGGWRILDSRGGVAEYEVDREAS